MHELTILFRAIEIFLPLVVLSSLSDAKFISAIPDASDSNTFKVLHIGTVKVGIMKEMRSSKNFHCPKSWNQLKL